MCVMVGTGGTRIQPPVDQSLERFDCTPLLSTYRDIACHKQSFCRRYNSDLLETSDGKRILQTGECCWPELAFHDLLTKLSMGNSEKRKEERM